MKTEQTIENPEDLTIQQISDNFKKYLGIVSKKQKIKNVHVELNNNDKTIQFSCNDESKRPIYGLIKLDSEKGTCFYDITYPNNENVNEVTSCILNALKIA